MSDEADRRDAERASGAAPTAGARRRQPTSDRGGERRRGWRASQLQTASAASSTRSRAGRCRARPAVSPAIGSRSPATPASSAAESTASAPCAARRTVPRAGCSDERHERQQADGRRAAARRRTGARGGRRASSATSQPTAKTPYSDRRALRRRSRAGRSGPRARVPARAAGRASTRCRSRRRGRRRARAARTGRSVAPSAAVTTPSATGSDASRVTACRGERLPRRSTVPSARGSRLGGLPQRVAELCRESPTRAGACVGIEGERGVDGARRGGAGGPRRSDASGGAPAWIARATSWMRHAPERDAGR